MIYRIWNPDDGDESSARMIEAVSLRVAAQSFAARDEWDSEGARTYHVRDDAGRLWSVVVSAAMVPVFRAREPERVKEESPGVRTGAFDRGGA